MHTRSDTTFLALMNSNQCQLISGTPTTRILLPPKNVLLPVIAKILFHFGLARLQIFTRHIVFPIKVREILTNDTLHRRINRRINTKNDKCTKSINFPASKSYDNTRPRLDLSTSQKVPSQSTFSVRRSARTKWRKDAHYRRTRIRSHDSISLSNIGTSRLME